MERVADDREFRRMCDELDSALAGIKDLQREGDDLRHDLRAAVERAEEAERRAKLDREQCDRMTQEAGRLAQRLAEAEKAGQIIDEALADRKKR